VAGKTGHSAFRCKEFAMSLWFFVLELLIALFFGGDDN
jgi:hypothetical protein